MKNAFRMTLSAVLALPVLLLSAGLGAAMNLAQRGSLVSATRAPSLRGLVQGAATRRTENLQAARFPQRAGQLRDQISPLIMALGDERKGAEDSREVAERINLTLQGAEGIPAGAAGDAPQAGAPSAQEFTRLWTKVAAVGAKQLEIRRPSHLETSYKLVRPESGIERSVEAIKIERVGHGPVDGYGWLVLFFSAKAGDKTKTYSMNESGAIPVRELKGFREQFDWWQSRLEDKASSAAAYSRDSLEAAWKIAGAIVIGIFAASVFGPFALFWAAIFGGLFGLVAAINAITEKSGKNSAK